MFYKIAHIEKNGKNSSNLNVEAYSLDNYVFFLYTKTTRKNYMN
jgi:hypothetical protein